MGHKHLLCFLLGLFESFLAKCRRCILLQVPDSYEGPRLAPRSSEATGRSTSDAKGRRRCFLSCLWPNSPRPNCPKQVAREFLAQRTHHALSVARHRAFEITCRSFAGHDGQLGTGVITRSDDRVALQDQSCCAALRMACCGQRQAVSCFRNACGQQSGRAMLSLPVHSVCPRSSESPSRLLQLLRHAAAPARFWVSAERIEVRAVTARG